MKIALNVSEFLYFRSIFTYVSLFQLFLIVFCLYLASFGFLIFIIFNLIGENIFFKCPSAFIKLVDYLLIFFKSWQCLLISFKFSEPPTFLICIFMIYFDSLPETFSQK